MKPKTIKKECAYRFRRFCRAGYAAFKSMHRVVNIGHLASYIADLQLKKSAVAMAVVVPFITGTALAQNDDSLDWHLLPTLDITAPADSLQGSPDAAAVITRSQLQGLPISSVGELLEQLPGIDLRTRGGGDVQGDITMRGGTFDQMAVLLNGVNISDAQTGHHNLDIPIDISMIDRVEIIPSSALIHYGITSFCGAINIVTGERRADGLQAQVSGGSYNQQNASLGATKIVGDWNLMAATSYHHSDGYMANTDFDHASLYLQAHQHDSVGDWLLQLGGQFKDFGSQAFYSIKYPDQYEETRTLMASISRQRKWHGWNLDAMVYGRLHKDRFELFREGYVDAPSWYADHNYHLSANTGARLRANRSWRLGLTSFGAEIRDEAILSNVLGDSLDAPIEVRWEPSGHYYTLYKNRVTTNGFVEHSLSIRKLRVSGGLLLSHNSMMGFDHGYSISADYPVSNTFVVRGSFGRSLRVPTYTDLYYKSATQVSNPNLKSEHSHYGEVSLRYSEGRLYGLTTLYYRHGTNIIDWVRPTTDDLWYCMNHTEIDAYGADVQFSYQGKGLVKRAGVNYSFCNVEQQPDGYLSNYVLDYLKHKVGLDLVLAPMKELRVKILGDYHYREGGYTDLTGDFHSYEPVLLINGGVEYDYWKCTFFVDGYNLLGQNYRDYGGVPQAGLSVIGGVRLKL